MLVGDEASVTARFPETPTNPDTRCVVVRPGLSDQHLQLH
jgi:hypothetical protein